MICNHCGRKIGDNLKQCPECGMPTQNFHVPTYSYRDESQSYQRSNSGNQAPSVNKGNGVGGMVMGIIACTSGVLGAIFGIIGFILSIVALTKRNQPKGMATAGLILSILSIPICIVYSAFYFTVILPMII